MINVINADFMTSFQPLLGFILLCIFNFMLFCISLCIFILYDVDIVFFIAAFGKALCLLCIKHCDTCKNVYYLIREEWYYIYLEAGYHLYCNDGQRHGLSLSSYLSKVASFPHARPSQNRTRIMGNVFFRINLLID